MTLLSLVCCRELVCIYNRDRDLEDELQENSVISLLDMHKIRIEASRQHSVHTTIKPQEWNSLDWRTKSQTNRWDFQRLCPFSCNHLLVFAIKKYFRTRLFGFGACQLDYSPREKSTDCEYANFDGEEKWKYSLHLIKKYLILCDLTILVLLLLMSEQFTHSNLALTIFL